MKKIFLLILMFFILTGCTNEYTLVIGKGKIKESLLSSVPSSKENTCKRDSIPECDNNHDEILSVNINPLLNNPNAAYEKKEYTENGENYMLRTYDFTYENFGDSYTLNECFDSYEYKNKMNELYIYATNFTKCYQNSDVTIKVVTNYKVYEHNADKKEGNTYIWYINNDNYNTKDLSIRLRSFSLTPYIVWPITVTVAGGIIYYLYKKSQKVNEIN